MKQVLSPPHIIYKIAIWQPSRLIFLQQGISQNIDLLKEYGIPVGKNTCILTDGRILRYSVTSYYRDKLESFLDSHPELKKNKRG